MSTATNENKLRHHAEQQFAEELEELKKSDARQRPANWELSPWAVCTYLLGGKLQRAAQFGDALGHDADFLFLRGGHGQDDRVEAPFERGGQFVDALVAVVRRGDEVEAAHGLHFVVELGDGEGLFGQDGDQRILHVGGDAGQFLHAGDAALGHGAHERAFDQRGAGRPFGEQFRIVPAIPHLFFAGARRTL